MNIISKTIKKCKKHCEFIEHPLNNHWKHFENHWNIIKIIIEKSLQLIRKSMKNIRLTWPSNDCQWFFNHFSMIFQWVFQCVFNDFERIFNESSVIFQCIFNDFFHWFSNDFSLDFQCFFMMLMCFFDVRWFAQLFFSMISIFFCIDFPMVFQWSFNAFLSIFNVLSFQWFFQPPNQPRRNSN